MLGEAGGIATSYGVRSVMRESRPFASSLSPSIPFSLSLSQTEFAAYCSLVWGCDETITGAARSGVNWTLTNWFLLRWQSDQRLCLTEPSITPAEPPLIPFVVMVSSPCTDARIIGADEVLATTDQSSGHCCVEM